MATESQASISQSPTLRRDRQLELYRRALKTLPGARAADSDGPHAVPGGR